MYKNEIVLPNNIPCRDIKDVIRIESMSNYSKVFIIGRPAPYVVARVLKSFANMLPPEIFIRVHQSHLVNRSFIKSKKGKGPDQLVLKNGDIISISKRYKTNFKINEADSLPA